MSDSAFHIEVFCQQKNHDGERICGDMFLSRKVKEEGRTIVVLSDGMGHGVKANVLATLTSTMALNFTRHHKDANKIAEIIMNTLPVCSIRKMSYSTFTIVDIEAGGMVRIIEYDNPQTTIIRNNKLFDPGWQCILLNSKDGDKKEILTCTFMPAKEDRIVLCTDGVVQSGMGSDRYPFGWGLDDYRDFVLGVVDNENLISAQKLAAKVVSKSFNNDGMKARDDTSCAVIYLREPRKMIVSTGPPFDKSNDAIYASKVKAFSGKKIVCGATTADILAREWKAEIIDSFDFEDPDLPPVSYMEGLDLITEGILTLGKVNTILRDYNSETRLGKGPADEIVKMLLESDLIHFLIGTGINVAHQDPTLPVDLEIRRTVVRRIARILEDKFLKEVNLEFL